MGMFFGMGFSFSEALRKNDREVASEKPSPIKLIPPFPTSINRMQINSIPHPFNLNGTNPYAIWVNGERLRLNREQTKAIAANLNIKFSQPKDSEEIHSGSGWQRPFELIE